MGDAETESTDPDITLTEKDPYNRIYPLPMTFESEWSNTYTNTIRIVDGDVIDTESVSVSSSVDAYGTMTMPGGESHDALRIRGDKFRGKLFRMGMGLQIEQGQGFEIDATVFVPILDAGQRWPHPNFLGLSGFLERVRFAVDPDPEERAFYFGPTGS